MYHLGFNMMVLRTRSSRTELFCKKGILRNFVKFTGKHLCQGLFFNKVAGTSLKAWLLLLKLNNSFKQYSIRGIIYQMDLFINRLIYSISCKITGKHRCRSLLFNQVKACNLTRDRSAVNASSMFSFVVDGDIHIVFNFCVFITSKILNEI